VPDEPDAAVEADCLVQLLGPLLADSGISVGGAGKRREVDDGDGRHVWGEGDD
jgi:hypothetical protein